MLDLVGLREFLAKKFWFTNPEWVSYGVASIALGFLYSFNDWGSQTLNISVGIGNFIIFSIIAALVLFAHHAAQRIVGLHYGVETTFSLWWYGLIIAFAVAVLTNGTLAFLALTGTTMITNKRLRVGRLRYRAGVFDYATVAVAGSLGTLFLAATLKTLVLWLPIFPVFFVTFVDLLFRFSMFFIFWNLFPIPPLDGSKILYGSRLLYVLIAFSWLAYILLISLFDVFSFFIAFLVGIIAWFLYYYHVESKDGD